MWYLHNEIAVSVAPYRKYHISKIKRYKITYKTTWEFWNVHKRFMGAFVAFDSGRCTATSVCSKIWRNYGYIIGCQTQNTDVAAYVSDTVTRTDGQCTAPFCNAPVWYSLPGECPDTVYRRKDAVCKAQQPGGRCDKATGAMNCTYHVEEAGDILLSDLIPETKDYKAFFDAGNKEYDVANDRGVGTDFWDGKKDLQKCANRIQAVKDLFKAKFPSMPDLPEPPCDFDMYYQNEFQWPSIHHPKLPEEKTKNN